MVVMGLALFALVVGGAKLVPGSGSECTGACREGSTPVQRHRWLLANKADAGARPPAGELSDDDFNIYVINLPRNTERLDTFKISYARSDFRVKPFNLVAAVDWKSLTPEQVRNAVCMARGRGHVDAVGLICVLGNGMLRS